MSNNAHQAAEPEEVSALRASIPSAVEQLDHLVDALERIVIHAKLLPARGRPPRLLFKSAVGCAEDALRLWRTSYPGSAQAVEAYSEYWADGGGWERDMAASAIEARSDATPKSDAAEGESAVPNGETPKGYLP